MFDINFGIGVRLIYGTKVLYGYTNSTDSAGLLDIVNSLSTKELSFIAIYSTFAAVARIPFYSLPGIQPCSYLILVVGYVFGPLIGCMIGANVAIISNLVLGQGAWTVYQIIAWGFIGVVGVIIELIIITRRFSPGRLQGTDDRKGYLTNHFTQQ